MRNSFYSHFNPQDVTHSHNTYGFLLCTGLPISSLITQNCKIAKLDLDRTFLRQDHLQKKSYLAKIDFCSSTLLENDNIYCSYLLLITGPVSSEGDSLYPAVSPTVLNVPAFLVAHTSHLHLLTEFIVPLSD